MTGTSITHSIARFAGVCAALLGLGPIAFAQEPASESNGSAAEPASAPPAPNPPPYAAWRGVGPHAPPPAIVLRAPPAPELPPPEYLRRPLELTPELLLALPNCAAGSENHVRCQGLGAGAGFGGSALWRVTPYFAFGGTLNALRFGFNPPSFEHLQNGRASGLFYGLIGRVYFADHGPVEPYLELGLGSGTAARTTAGEADGLAYTETAGGGAVRVGGAVELYFGRQVRLGPALDWTRFRVGHVQRCDPTSACADLDPAQNDHGVGFLTFSARLTILVGAGL